MEETFNSVEFIGRIGRRLVNEFDDARQATTPSLVGDAMEVPVRNQLENILPSGIAIGSGCVIDSYGHTSRKMDVVLYEREICPVFSINNTPDTTYYPCEGVIAVGEVKSTFSARELRDSIEKIASVKSLSRYIVTANPSELDYLPDVENLVHYRGYGDIEVPSVINATRIDNPEAIEYSRIYGFILTGELRISGKTLLTRFAEYSASVGDSLCPNLLVALNGGILVPVCADKKEYRFSAESASDFLLLEKAPPFQSLVQRLYIAYEKGLTSPFESFSRYLFSQRDPATLYNGPTVPKGTNTPSCK